MATTEQDFLERVRRRAAGARGAPPDVGEMAHAPHQERAGARPEADDFVERVRARRRQLGQQRTGPARSSLDIDITPARTRPSAWATGSEGSGSGVPSRETPAPASSSDTAPDRRGFAARVRELFKAPEKPPSILDVGPGAAHVVQPGELEADDRARREGAAQPPKTEFGRGLRTGLASARVGVGETLETVGGLTDRPGIERLGEIVSEGGRAIQRTAPGRVQRIEDIGSLDDFGAWAAFALGQGLGSTAAPVAGGLAGGAVAGPVGAAAGALGPSYALILGEIRGELEEANVDPVTIDRVAPLVAVPASALEAILPASIGRRATTATAAGFGRDLARRIATRAAQGAVTEGLTEAGQTAISRGTTAALSDDVDFLTPETLSDLVNAALAGALPGAVLGGAGGAVTEGRMSTPGARSRPSDRGASPTSPAPGASDGSFLTRVRRRAAEVIDPSGAEERRAAQRALETDPLTGLGSRTALTRARAQIDQDPGWSWIAIDADGLKAVNESEGHAAGDAFLQRIGNVISGLSERGFHPHGDEFMVAAPMGEGEVLGRRIAQAVGRTPIADTGLDAGISFGAGETLDAADAELGRRKAERRAQGVGRSIDGGRAPAAFWIPPTEVIVEPERFQFKESLNPQGETGALRDVPVFDENRAGVVMLWRDPADGQPRVVNGHQRLALARRLGAPRVRAIEIDAATAEDARLEGALVNISEGSGTAVDAAKVFRQTGLVAEDLRARGVPLTGAVARDGLAIARLHEGLFDLVARGRIPVARAAVIGRSGLEPEQQMALWELVKKQEARRRLTNAEIEELARFVRGSGTEQATQETLFGTETFDESLALEKARLSAWAKGQLRKQARLFQFVSRGERAEQIKQAGVGTIDTEAAGALGNEAAQVAEVYERLSASAGPVSDALNRAVREIRAGANEHDVRTRLLEDARTAVQEVVGRRQGSGAAGGQATPGDVRGVRPQAERGRVGGRPDARGRGGVKPLADTDVDLFGEPVRREEVQGELAPARGPQGMSEALQQAHATVSGLQGRVDRGAATPDELRRYREARALLRRSEGMDAEDVARSRDAGGPREPGDTRDLFEDRREPVRLRTDIQAGSKARLTETSSDPDFDVLDEGDIVHVLSVDDLEGTAEVRVDWGGGRIEVYELPLDVLAPLPRRPAGGRDTSAADPQLDAPTESPLGGAEALEAEVTIGGEARTLRPIAPVELVRMAGHLLKGSRLFTKRFPQSRGAFYPDPDNPRIGLHPNLGRDYEQFTRTLAHEVGHLVDFLDDATMSRGNILGRIASLRTYMSETLAALPTNKRRAILPDDRRRIRRAAEKEAGARPKRDEEAALEAWRERVRTRYAEMILEEMEARNMLGRERVHEELLLLSEWWRPYDRKTASAGHVRYRESSTELYADALSVLLNSPGSLQARAPQFFEAWLAYIDEKPSVRDAYEEVQKLLAGGEAEIYAARRAELEADFARGEEIQRASEERTDPQSFVAYLKQQLVSRSAPATGAERRRLKARGQALPAHSAEHALKMALQEHNHGDNVNRVMLMDIDRDVHKPLLEAGVSQDSAGAYLMLHRVAEGDRGGLAEQAKEAIMELTGERTWAAARAAYEAAGRAQGTSDATEGFEFDASLLELAETGVLNPHGYTPVEARRQLDGMRADLGPEAFDVLERSMTSLREIVFRSVEEAVRVGSYSRELFETRIKPNRETYAPFAVLHYFSGRMTAGVRKQIGTVSGIANPYTVSIMKAMTLNRLNEHQKAKRAILDVLDRDFPGQGEVQRVDKFHREVRPGPGRENLTYLVDGKLHYRAVDTYIARMLQASDLGGTERLIKTLASRTYGLFHPLYVSWSLAWQARNVTRDWKRTFKNLASAHAGQPTHRQALEAVLDFGRVLNAYGATAGAAWRHARRRDDALIREMLEDRALGRAFHSFEPVESDLTHERLLARYGLVKPLHGGARGAARAVGHPIEIMGVFQETWSKAAAFRMLGERGIDGRERAYIVRNYTGTPDSSDRGLASDATNTLFLYANVIMAGLRADAEVAVQPSTAAGYWLRSVAIDFAPKMIMAAALAGWLGDELKEWMERIPSYDLEKYLIVPIPPFWSTNERGDSKAVYLRVPHDDANRILAASTWALIMGNRPYAPSHAAGILAGEFPGLNPGIDLPIKWTKALSGENPYDSWLGRPVVPRTEWEAGGWPRQKEMLRYTLGQFGIVSQVLGRWTYGGPQLPGEAAKGEELMRSIPGLSTLIKISDRGLDEERYWELDTEAQQRAQLRADLPKSVRDAVSERGRLNRFGDERLDDSERPRRRELNAWYRLRYLPLTAEMEAARDAENDEAYRGALQALERSLDEPVPTRSSRGRRRPTRPRRPSRRRR